MSVRLRIGNNFDETMPARAVLKELRFGDGFADEYSFMTACPVQGGQKLINSWPDSHEVTIDPIAQYFDHEDEIRMTGFADMFVPLTENAWYSRQDVDVLIFEVEDYRAEGNSTDANDEVGIKFKITRLDGTTSSDLGTVWFDNASFLTSDILWEFNTNHGDGRWWPLYQIPSRKFVRVTIPYRSDSLRLRAYSSNTGEWVQKAIVFPRDDAQTLDSQIAYNPTSLTLDEYGYMSWEPADGGTGRITYGIFGGDSSDTSSMTQIATTSDSHYQLTLPYTYGFFCVCAISSTSQTKSWYQVVTA